jgi:hypothetical protein
LEMSSGKLFTQDGLELWSFLSQPPKWLGLQMWPLAPGWSLSSLPESHMCQTSTLPLSYTLSPLSYQGLVFFGLSSTTPPLHYLMETNSFSLCSCNSVGMIFLTSFT